MATKIPRPVTLRSSALLAFGYVLPAEQGRFDAAQIQSHPINPHPHVRIGKKPWHAIPLLFMRLSAGLSST